MDLAVYSHQSVQETAFKKAWDADSTSSITKNVQITIHLVRESYILILAKSVVQQGSSKTNGKDTHSNSYFHEQAWGMKWRLKSFLAFWSNWGEDILVQIL